MKNSNSSRLTKRESDFLDQSNRIESEYSADALKAAKKAWRYARKVEKMSVTDLLEIHRILMADLNPIIAGKLRNGTVWIGGKMLPFISYVLLEQELGWVFEQMNDSSEFEYIDSPRRAEERAKANHISYENIHPFFDGNGRTGRILYNWERLRLGLPIHVIHEGEEQMEYYKWFNETNP